MGSLLACGGAELTRADVIEIAERRLARSNSRAADAASDVTVFDGSIRFNPANCECPPYELAVGQRWVRVDIEPAREPLESVVDWLAAPEGVLETRIELTRGEARADNGWRYRTILIGAPTDDPRDE